MSGSHKNNKGLLAVTLAIWRRAMSVDLPLISSSLSYTTILSVVPVLALSLSIFQLMGGWQKFIDRIGPAIFPYLAPGAEKIVQEIVESSIARVHSGTLGGVGVFFLILVCTRLFKEIDDSVQRIWRLKIGKRGLVWHMFIYWVLLILGPLAFALIMGFISGLALQGLPIDMIRVLSGGLIIFGFTVFYKFVPYRDVQFKVALVLSLVSFASIVGMKNLFWWLVENLFDYNEIYGSMAALPAFLIWIQAFWWLLLLGTATCAEIHSRDGD